MSAPLKTKVSAGIPNRGGHDEAVSQDGASPRELKVFFVGVGTTHYFNRVLSALQENLHIEIAIIVDADGTGHTGAGVHETIDGVTFRIIPLTQTNRLGKRHEFHGLKELVDEERPDVLVATEHYIKSIFARDGVRDLLVSYGAKLLLKSIPFRLFSYQEEVAMARNNSHPSRYNGSAWKIVSWIPFLGRALRCRSVERYREIYKAIDAHVVYVEEGKRIFGSYGVDPNSVFVTYNSPDTDRLERIRLSLEGEPRLLDPNPYRIIHVGRLVKWKKVDLLIEAVSKLRSDFPSIELLVVGEGPEKKNLENLATGWGLNDKSVRFLGAIHDSRHLANYLLVSEIYVLAGMGGLSINDAMAMGNPVVCSVCDGTEKHLVREGENGRFFKEGDVESLTAVLGEMLGDTEKLRAMGEESARIIREEINIHTVIDGYRRALEAVTDGSLQQR